MTTPARLGRARSHGGEPRQRAIDSTLIPIAIGQIIASLESLTVGSLYTRRSLLRGVSAREARPGTVKHRLLSILDSPATPKVLAGVSLVSAAILLGATGRRTPQVLACATLAACHRLNEVRTPYGRDGADQMTGVITQYRALSGLIPEGARADELFLRAVNWQAGLSYFVSGASKLFGASWIQGEALGQVLQTQAYGGGPAARFLKGRPRLTRALSLATPLWEVAFPMVYLLPARPARAALMGVKGFHLEVAAVMELPRFIWGFVGAHGSVQYVTDRPGPKTSPLELRVVISTAAVVFVCATYATAQRALDMGRRLGLNGTDVLEVRDGVVEFTHRPPSGAEAANAPVVLLEAGLGSPLEAWAWVADELGEDCHVVSYHRAGYGRTSTHAAPDEIVASILARTGSDGPLVVAAHSIGVLPLAQYAAADSMVRPIDALVVIDGTDPELFEADRSDRHRVGTFLQSQAHSMFAAVTGVYNFAPNAVARQSRYEPDMQNATVQFIFSPKSIYRSTREYFEIQTDGAFESLKQIPVRRLVASHENEAQQATLARKIGASFSVVAGSSHRSIIGYREYAMRVATEIRSALDAIL